MENNLGRRRPETYSTLIAAAISSGCRHQYFTAAFDIEYDLPHQSFDSTQPSLSEHDQQRLSSLLEQRARTEPVFWSDFAQRARAAGARLLDAARSSCSFGETPEGAERRLEGYLTLLEAMRTVAPFVATTPAVVALLESEVATGVKAAVGISQPEAAVADLLVRVRTPWAEPDARGAMRSGYQIALAVLGSEAMTELFLNTTPALALARVQAEFADLDQLIRQHVEDFGWLRARRYRHPPLSPEALVYRAQLALLRWSRPAIEAAARPPATPQIGDVVPIAPSDPLTERIAVLQAVLTERCFRPDILRQAESVARPLFAAIGEGVGRPPEQVMFASPDEVAAALTGGQEWPADKIESRLRHGFRVVREGDTVTIEPVPESGRSEDSPSSPQELTGMTACRGTAVGPVKVILGQADLHRLELGDVLVTAASTIDPTDLTDSGTVFPARRGGPNDEALERVAAVVADEGGLLSHAAIVCRERGLPAVLGTETATAALVEGQVVEVDATKPLGVVIPLD